MGLRLMVILFVFLQGCVVVPINLDYHDPCWVQDEEENYYWEEGCEPQPSFLDELMRPFKEDEYQDMYDAEPYKEQEELWD